MSKRFFVIVSLSILLALFFGCNSGKRSKFEKPEVKKGVAPVADNEVAVLDTDYGKITIELYSNIAPQTVNRFKELAREGFYNGTAFHRINSTVIQGGDPLSKGNDLRSAGAGGSDKPDVPAELSDAPFDTGIVGAARTQDYDSANSQFFIMLKREPQFDTDYTVFGKVTDGMNNVRTIAGAPREGERPMEPIRIKAVSIQPRK